MNIITRIKSKINFKINWSKVALDFYPTDIVKQFTRVSLPFYFSFSLVLFYILVNIESIFVSKHITIETVVAFYFVMPFLLPFTLLGLLVSSLHILRHHNPLYLFYMQFKHFLLYGVNFGMIFFSVLFLFIYGTILNRIFTII